VRILLAIAIAALLVPAPAAAQLFKCKGPDGKIVYSDTRCEAAASGDALKVSPNSTTGGGRYESPVPPPPAKAGEASARVDEAASAPATELRRPYELTSADRDRIRNLEVNANRLGAYPEQKSAAQLEIQSIRNGAESRLTGSEREKRDALTADLTSTDARKRSQALREIREIYYR
jgi:hypothetical protein